MSDFWLDETKIHDLRDFINRERPYVFDPQFQRAHTAICIMMDRCEDSASWLNAHSRVPESESDFYLFLVHGDIIRRTVVCAAQKLEIDLPFANKQQQMSRAYLAPHVTYDLTFDETRKVEKANDDIVWSYLRALAFAHIEKTGDKRYFGSLLKEHEIHYSPFVKIDTETSRVGVVVYSNDSNFSDTLMLPYDALKNFVVSRFVLIEKILSLAQERVGKRNKALENEVITLHDNPVETLRELRGKYIERSGDESYAYQFDFALMCLTCKNTLEDNKKQVEFFRHALEDKVPAIVDAFRKLDYNTCFRILDEVCDYSPNILPEGIAYYLQNVYAYLEAGDDREHFALQCARYVVRDFASKYVKVDVAAMNYDEIKMLITVACYCNKSGCKIDSL